MMRLRSRPLLYAHRGAAAERPENTLAAFARAIELGADALEMDAHRTSDGHLVVSHDPDGLRMAGVRRAIRDTTLADLASWDVGRGFVARDGGRPFTGARIPTLEQVLVELPGVPINLDLKRHDRAMAEATVALLRRLGAARRVTLASFDTATIRAVRQLGYEGPTALAQGEVVEVLTLPGPLWRRLSGRGTVAQIPARLGPMVLGNASTLARCHGLGIPVDYWTVDDPAEAARLLALGADGIMTNDPGRLAPLFRATSAL